MTARGDSLRCSRNPGSNFRSGLIAPREYRPRCRRRRRVAKVSCTAGPAKSDGNFRELCWFPLFAPYLLAGPLGTLFEVRVAFLEVSIDGSFGFVHRFVI